MAKRKNEFNWKNHEAYFTGSIDGKNVFDLTKIDYNLENSKERLDFLDALIKSCDGFLSGYFYCKEPDARDSEGFTEPIDEHERKMYYKYNPRTWKDVLAQDTNVCAVLETLATYLLNSRDIPLEKQQEYKIFTDEALFKAAQKELNTKSKANGSTENEILEFLVRNSSSNGYFAKDTKLTGSDFKDTEMDLGLILTYYDAMYQHLREHASKLRNGEKSPYSVTKVKRLMSGLKDDMILTKEKIKRPIELENNGDFKAITDWSQFDYTNEKHIKAILYFKPRKLSPNDDLAVIIYDVNNMILDLTAMGCFDKTDKEILEMLRSDFTLEEIAKELEFAGPTSIIRRLDSMSRRIADLARYLEK